MAKYYVNESLIKNVDCNVLIEAVARYISAEEYPSVHVIATILGIESAEETNG